jgi:hypothetical protein
MQLSTFHSPVYKPCSLKLINSMKHPRSGVLHHSMVVMRMRSVWDPHALSLLLWEEHSESARGWHAAKHDVRYDPSAAMSADKVTMLYSAPSVQRLFVPEPPSPLT